METYISLFLIDGCTMCLVDCEENHQALNNHRSFDVLKLNGLFGHMISMKGSAIMGWVQNSKETRNAQRDFDRMHEAEQEEYNFSNPSFN